MGALFGHGVALLTVATLVATALPAGSQTSGRGTRPAPRTTPPPSTSKRATPAPRVEAAVPFRVGETLTYDVAWSTYLVAGSAVSRVVEKRTANNPSAYYIVAEGRPLPIIARIYALYYKMDSLLDSFTTLSQRTSLYTEEGTRKRTVATTFDRAARRAMFEQFSEPPVKNDFAVPPDVQDGLATLYALRARPFKTGERIRVPVVDEGMLYNVTFEVTGPEPIKVPFGQVNAFNLRITVLDAGGQQIGRNIAAWISSDSKRLPVKLQADLPVGNFILALRSAQ
jgi:hypothetical protein